MKGINRSRVLFIFIIATIITGLSSPKTFTSVERFYSTRLTLFFICSALRFFT
ncbi:hypothetical protein CIT292_08558 [Citrobacter youngae ATCC 29220]|uniref:Uncharacterized protein n=1 Tax=Citrobacter youngae ATCC 29220 TaxID=500640 RepID=D4BDJ1_9ENTR|nr:hypothetical protein CIT292_08558 [Citrobacter youngae ATCC 29220]